MRKIFYSLSWLILTAFSTTTACYSQSSQGQQSPHPKIVIGLVVDQMRWDYLIRFRDLYGSGGFKRLLTEGFSCDNTLIDYGPSVTACGHTAVYSGSVPAITGIINNDWYDRYRHKKVYCTEDSTVQGVGIPDHSLVGQMSPSNLLVTTLGDEMNKADSFRSKVVGIALKDRAAILPAGHTATAAFWFDDKAGFITSSYYMQELPSWAKKFNEERAAFIHQNAIRNSAAGNDLTLEFAKAAIAGYHLGAGAVTDLLALSFSSPDAVGHQYGPNSTEIRDIYQRLDRQFSAFLTWLDGRFGKGNYLLFLTADHGVSPSPAYALDHRMPAGAFDPAGMMATLNDSLASKFQVTSGIEYVAELQLYLNRAVFEQKGISLAAVEDYICGLSASFPGIADILPEGSLSSASLPQELKDRLINGYNRRRSGDLVILPQPGWKIGSLKGADHGLVYVDDTHIPLLFMGWRIPHGRTNRRTAMTDIAPTLSTMLEIQPPSGSIGRPIEEITGK
jgi:Type I phosphodiesterase / nucleotide pyrophosphatase